MRRERRRLTTAPLEHLDEVEVVARRGTIGEEVSGLRLDGAAVARPTVEVQPARALLAHQLGALLGMSLRDDVAVLVVGDRQQPVHALELGPGQADAAGQIAVGLPDHLALAHVGAHGGQAVQHAADRLGVARAQEVRQVLQRDAQVVDRAEDVVGVRLVAVGLQRRDHGRQRRHVPDHRQRAELGMQRQRDAPSAPRGRTPGNGGRARASRRGCRRAGRLAHLVILGVQEDGALASSRSRSSGTEAASSTRSAS